MSEYIGEFGSIQDIADWFACAYGVYPSREDIFTELANAEILIAAYLQRSRDGEAFVLYRKGDKMFRVDGGHCSCCGLEGQWEPVETDLKTLAYEVQNGTRWGRRSYHDEEERALRSAVRGLVGECPRQRSIEGE